MLPLRLLYVLATFLALPAFASENRCAEFLGGWSPAQIVGELVRDAWRERLEQKVVQADRRRIENAAWESCEAPEARAALDLLAAAAANSQNSALKEWIENLQGGNLSPRQTRKALAALRALNPKDTSYLQIDFFANLVARGKEPLNRQIADAIQRELDAAGFVAAPKTAKERMHEWARNRPAIAEVLRTVALNGMTVFFFGSPSYVPKLQTRNTDLNTEWNEMRRYGYKIVGTAALGFLASQVWQHPWQLNPGNYVNLIRTFSVTQEESETYRRKHFDPEKYRKDNFGRFKQNFAHENQEILKGLELPNPWDPNFEAAVNALPDEVREDYREEAEAEWEFLRTQSEKEPGAP